MPDPPPTVISLSLTTLRQGFSHCFYFYFQKKNSGDARRYCQFSRSLTYSMVRGLQPNVVSLLCCSNPHWMAMSVPAEEVRGASDPCQRTSLSWEIWQGFPNSLRLWLSIQTIVLKLFIPSLFPPKLRWGEIFKISEAQKANNQFLYCSSAKEEMATPLFHFKLKIAKLTCRIISSTFLNE